MNVKFFATALVSLAAISTFALTGCMEGSTTEGTEPVVVEEMPAEEGTTGMMEEAGAKADEAAADVAATAEDAADKMGAAAHDAKEAVAGAAHGEAHDAGHESADHHG